MQHLADGQNKQLEEKCSNIFWNIMRRWVRAHLIMLSWHLKHFAALTSLKAEQIAQLNPSAETNHANQICIKPPKKSKEHIALGPAPRALVEPISLWQHCNVLNCAVSWGALGAERAEMAPAAHGFLFPGVSVPSAEVCSLQPPCLMVTQNWWQISFKGKLHLSCTLFTRSPCEAALAQSRTSAVPLWVCNSICHLGQYRLVLCPYYPHF